MHWLSVINCHHAATQLCRWMRKQNSLVMLIMMMLMLVLNLMSWTLLLMWVDSIHHLVIFGIMLYVHCFFSVALLMSLPRTAISVGQLTRYILLMSCCEFYLHLVKEANHVMLTALACYLLSHSVNWYLAEG